MTNETNVYVSADETTASMATPRILATAPHSDEKLDLVQRSSEVEARVSRLCSTHQNAAQGTLHVFVIRRFTHE